MTAELRIHGGLHDAELRALGVDQAAVVDFSVNINPYGPHPKVVASVRQAQVQHYPDPTARQTREVLAAHLKTTPDSLALGHGVADLLWHVARLLMPQGPALIVEPTFGEYRAALTAAGSFDDSAPRHEIIAFTTSADVGFVLDLQRLSAVAQRSSVKSLWLCSPNNPTGVRVPPQELAHWATAHPGITVVLDQSFVSLSAHPEDLTVAMPGNVICLRSLTKDHALAGLRVGYLCADPHFIHRFESSRAPWSCGTPAQAAIRATCAHESFLEDCRRRLFRDREELRSALKRRLGLTASVGDVPFFLVPVRNAARLRRALLQRRQILVRDCESFGLQNTLRLAARPAEDRLLLLQALEEVLPDVV